MSEMSGPDEGYAQSEVEKRKLSRERMRSINGILRK